MITNSSYCKYYQFPLYKLLLNLFIIRYLTITKCFIILIFDLYNHIYDAYMMAFGIIHHISSIYI
jgi:hypothetical protein